MNKNENETKNTRVNNMMMKSNINNFNINDISMNNMNKLNVDNKKTKKNYNFLQLNKYFNKHPISTYTPINNSLSAE